MRKIFGKLVAVSFVAVLSFFALSCKQPTSSPSEPNVVDTYKAFYLEVKSENETQIMELHGTKITMTSISGGEETMVMELEKDGETYTAKSGEMDLTERMGSARIKEMYDQTIESFILFEIRDDDTFATYSEGKKVTGKWEPEGSSAVIKLDGERIEVTTEDDWETFEFTATYTDEEGDYEVTAKFAKQNSDLA